MAYPASALGAVIVSTPQDVALSDVRKGIAMLRKVSVPVTLFHSFFFDARSHPVFFFLPDNRANS